MKKFAGKIKGGFGKVIGNDQMDAEGKAHEAKGKAKKEAGNGAERAKGKVQEVIGTVKNRVGHASDDEELEVKGKAQELQGKGRQAIRPAVSRPDARSTTSRQTEEPWPVQPLDLAPWQ